MKCPFRDCENMEDNVNFDEPAAHIILTIGSLGHTHVHGPFENEFFMTKMADALIETMRKMGINYVLPKIVPPAKGKRVIEK